MNLIGFQLYFENDENCSWEKKKLFWNSSFLFEEKLQSSSKGGQTHLGAGLGAHQQSSGIHARRIAATSTPEYSLVDAGMDSNPIRSHFYWHTSMLI